MLKPRLLSPLRVLEALSATVRPAAQQQLAQPQWRRPAILSAAARSTALSLTASRVALSFAQIQVRHASHATQGTGNRHSRDPAGKRLGAKRSGGEYVVPGCIIFRQRGTKWFPGENCAMGRDHTIYAAEAGYVRYYLDPERHPDRKYIGVCFEKDGKLPTPRNAPTKRKLNRVAVPLVLPGLDSTVTATTAAAAAALSAQSDVLGQVASAQAVNSPYPGPQLRPGYMYREANWEIGRAAERAGISAKPHARKNRWLAWRKRKARAQKVAQMKSLKSKKKSAKKGSAGR